MEDKNQKSSKRVIWASLVIVVFVVVGGVFGLVVPVTKKVFSLKDELEKNKLEHQKVEKEIAEREKIAETITTIKKQGEVLERAIIKEETAVVFIEEIEKLAQEAGNKISIIPTSSPKKKSSQSKDDEDEKQNNSKNKSNKSNSADKNEEVYFNLKLEGNYSQFLRFLCQLENLGYVFNVESVSLVSKPKLEQGSSLRGSQTEDKKPEGVLESNVLISFSVKEIKNQK